MAHTIEQGSWDADLTELISAWGVAQRAARHLTLHTHPPDHEREAAMALYEQAAQFNTHLYDFVAEVQLPGTRNREEDGFDASPRRPRAPVP